MKRIHSILPSLAVCLLVLLAVWHSETPSASETGHAAKTAASAEPVRVSAGGAPAEHPTPLASRELRKQLAGLSDVKFPTRADRVWEVAVSEPAFEEFRRWTAGFPAARTGADLQRGIELAQQRRHELLNLIEKNPRRALELAVPRFRAAAVAGWRSWPCSSSAWTRAGT